MIQEIKRGDPTPPNSEFKVLSVRCDERRSGILLNGKDELRNAFELAWNRESIREREEQWNQLEKSFSRGSEYYSSNYFLHKPSLLILPYRGSDTEYLFFNFQDYENDGQDAKSLGKEFGVLSEDVHVSFEQTSNRFTLDLSEIAKRTRRIFDDIASLSDSGDTSEVAKKILDKFKTFDPRFLSRMEHYVIGIEKGVYVYLSPSSSLYQNRFWPNSSFGDEKDQWEEYGTILNGPNYLHVNGDSAIQFLVAKPYDPKKPYATPTFDPQDHAHMRRIASRILNAFPKAA